MCYYKKMDQSQELNEAFRVTVRKSTPQFVSFTLDIVYIFKSGSYT